MTTCRIYDCLIPAWYFETHSARGTATSHLHFPHCCSQCYRQDQIHPEYSTSYNTRIVLDKFALQIGY